MKQVFEQDLKLDQLFSSASVSWHIFRHQVFVRKSHLPVLFKDGDFCGADWKYIFSFQRTIRSVCACECVCVCVCVYVGVTGRTALNDAGGIMSVLHLTFLFCHVCFTYCCGYHGDTSLFFLAMCMAKRDKELKGRENVQIQETCTRMHEYTHTHTHTWTQIHTQKNRNTHKK